MGLRKSSDLKQGFRDCPGDPLAKTRQGTWVQSLVGELDPKFKSKIIKSLLQKQQKMY